MAFTDRILDRIMARYEKNGHKFEKIDFIIWKFWLKVFPKIAFIPLVFWVLKKVFIDYMLPHYGFEKTIVYLAIIIMIRPMLSDLLKTILDRTPI